MQEIFQSFFNTVNIYNEFYESLENTKRKFGDYELYPSEIHTLVDIRDNKDKNFTQISEYIGITKGAFTKLSDKLIKKGLVKKYYKQGNKKSIYFSITKAGEKACIAHEDFHSRADFNVSSDDQRYYAKNKDTILQTFERLNQMIIEMNNIINNEVVEASLLDEEVLGSISKAMEGSFDLTKIDNIFNLK